MAEIENASPGMHILTKNGDVPHLECTSTLGMGMCLTGNAHPHQECGCASTGMHILTILQFIQGVHGNPPRGEQGIFWVLVTAAIFFGLLIKISAKFLSIFVFNRIFWVQIYSPSTSVNTVLHYYLLVLNIC